MPSLRDLATILYRPRETMRRVLDATDRWAPQVVALEFVCASVNDGDMKAVAELAPGLKLWPVLAILALGLIAGALLWVALLYVLSWIGWYAGTRLGGTASIADVRAAFAWAMVPVIWSALYRVPLGILQRQLAVVAAPNVSSLLIDFASKGGCSLIAIFFALQLAFAIWCIWIGSNTVAEAQHFTTAKGFGNVAVTLAVPMAIVVAAIAARHVG